MKIEENGNRIGKESNGNDRLLCKTQLSDFPAISQ